MSLILVTVLIVALTYLMGVSVQKNRLGSFMSSTFLISMSAGILLCLAIVEFLPHSLEKTTVWTYPLILMGILVIIFSERYIAPYIFQETDSCDPNSECSHTHHVSKSVACTSIGCIAVCSFFDGIELSAAFSMSRQMGWFIGIGLVLHILPEGAMAASLSKVSGFSEKGVHKSVIIICTFLIVGVLVGFGLGQFIEVQGYLLPFVTGLLIYVCIGHLFPVAFRDPYGFLYIIIGAALMFMVSFWGHANHDHIL